MQRPTLWNDWKEGATMVTRKLGNTVEVDIHGLTESDAKRQLEQFLSRADASLQEVVVIHGYHNGQILRDMVRLKLKHPRIRSKLISLNPGATRLLLK